MQKFFLRRMNNQIGKDKRQIKVSNYKKIRFTVVEMSNDSPFFKRRMVLSYFITKCNQVKTRD